MMNRELEKMLGNDVIESIDNKESIAEIENNVGYYLKYISHDLIRNIGNVDMDLLTYVIKRYEKVYQEVK